MVGKNIDYWEELVKLNKPSFVNLFQDEKKFLYENIPRNSQVLDVCCGTGRTIETLLPITKNIAGIDYDTSAIETARNLFRSYPKINFIYGNALQMPFENDSFDYSICMDSVVNFENKKRDLLYEMGRVSREGVLISVYNEDALKDRLEAYKGVKAPITSVDLEGTCKFDIPFATSSEQFTEEKLRSLCDDAKMKISSLEKRGIGYFCKLIKK